MFTGESGILFWHKSASLVFDINEDCNNPRGQYYTFFHEMGHAIDYFYGKENGEGGYYSTTFTTNGKTLSDYNIIDVENNIKSNLEIMLQSKEFDNLSDDEKQKND